MTRRHEVRTPVILHAPVSEPPQESEVRTPIVVETLVRPVVVTPVRPPVLAAPVTHAWWLHHQGPRAWWLRPNPHAVAHPVRTARPLVAPAVTAPAVTAPAVTAPATTAPPARAPRATGPERVPLSAYLLRLQTVRLRGWQRVLLFEGTFLLAVVVALADFATAWLPVVVPFAVGAMLKLHDVVLTQLHRNARAAGTPRHR